MALKRLVKLRNFQNDNYWGRLLKKMIADLGKQEFKLQKRILCQQLQMLLLNS
jgi:hypothetical protein